MAYKAYKTASQLLADFGATLKRTGTALHSLKDELLRQGKISEKEAETLLKAAAILAKISPDVAAQKSRAKKQEVEAEALLKRMTDKTRQAVDAAFKDLGMEDSVAFLVFREESLSYLKLNMPLQRERFPELGDNHVLAVLGSELNDARRHLVSDIAWKPKTPEEVIALVEQEKKEFEANRPDILRRIAPFIEELKTAATAQALHRANK